MKKIATYFLLLWVIINIGLFIGSGNLLFEKENNVFFPFGQTVEEHYVHSNKIVKNAVDINDYDYTEFLVYVFPAIIIVIAFRNRRAKSFKKESINLKKSASYSDIPLESQNRKIHNKKIGILIAAALVVVFIFILPNINKIGEFVNNSRTPSTTSPALKIDVISFNKISSSMVRIQAKFTNISGSHINRAKGTAVIYNSNGNEIGFADHYVIKSTEGGLKPNESTRFTFIVNVNGDASSHNVEVKILD